MKKLIALALALLMLVGMIPASAETAYTQSPYLDGLDLWEINQIARRATFTAHSGRGIPCLNLEVPALNAYWLGQMFYYFMFACYLSCELTGVNAFDQPGVEGYKKEMFHHLGKPGY